MIEIGIKSDPIETRYSFEWLFEVMKEEGIRKVQLGSFFELYHLNFSYFENLLKLAEKWEIEISSLFTAHRELGGFFYGDIHMEKVARSMYERLIEVAVFLGANYCGSNPGAVYRDKATNKNNGSKRYIKHMKELSSYAKELGLEGLTIEPMSSLAEPPSTIDEINSMLVELNDYHKMNEGSTVPFYLCGDISHGLMSANRVVIHSNYELFKEGFPWMCEFHFKNTDSYFESTFGFSKEEQKKGIIDLSKIKEMISSNSETLPVKRITGYLEISGPKTGRDYSDPLLARCLKDSLRELKNVFY